MKTLFKDCCIYPMDNSLKTYKYMVISQDKIVYLANERPPFKVDKEVSLKGKYLYPTLTDSHLHLLYSLVSAANTFNICSIIDGKIVPDNINDIKDSIIQYVNNHSKDKLIIINSYITPAIKENRLPTSNELDLWCDNKEVVVFSIDGHSASLSTSLLKKLNIDSKDGILSGSNYDLNQGIITDYVANSVSLFTLYKGVVNFTNECYKYGISKVCALDGEDDGTLDNSLLDALILLAQRMDIKVRLYPQYHNYKILDKYSKVLKIKRIGGCSLWELDGSVGSHSAAFYYPFKDTNTLSELYYEPSYLKDKIHEALTNNIQFTSHAIGTKAIDEIVDAYLDNESLLNNELFINRIDHFEFPSEKACDFVINHRIAITFQPGYSYIDKRFIHSYERYLNEDNLKYLAKLKYLVDNGVLVLGSSDSPVQSINPYDQMLGMVNYYIENESISNYEAFKTYTTNPSSVLNEDDGQLKVNGQASFFISDYDIININKNDINKVVANQVYIDGKKVKKKRYSIFSLICFFLRKPHKI